MNQKEMLHDLKILLQLKLKLHHRATGGTEGDARVEDAGISYQTEKGNVFVL